jgi:hypothetical protein
MRTLIFLVIAGLSSAGAYAITAKLLASHTHTDLAPGGSELPDVGHSGGLDQNGGHYDRSTGRYHYHR